MIVLRLHCQDQPGIVAAVAMALSDSGCNIEESSQFHDPFSGHFFMRVVFSAQKDRADTVFKKAFAAIAARFEMVWHIDALGAPVRTLLLVSKQDHCLNDILYRWRAKHLNIDIAGILSNHETLRGFVEAYGIPFHHLCIDEAAKTSSQMQIAARMERDDAELAVLARYMQVLPAALCERYAGRIINIHHSFLPGFKGAKPYCQAYERGVKIIGATAHFATEDLDEGPIIAQDTVAIDHSFTPAKMQSLGRDTESRVLARAIQLYTERRIFLHGKRTVIL